MLCGQLSNLTLGKLFKNSFFGLLKQPEEIPAQNPGQPDYPVEIEIGVGKFCDRRTVVMVGQSLTGIDRVSEVVQWLQRNVPSESTLGFGFSSYVGDGWFRICIPLIIG